MTVCRNFFLAAGAVAISYLMLKYFKIQKKKTSQETNEEINEEEKAEVDGEEVKEEGRAEVNEEVKEEGRAEVDEEEVKEEERAEIDEEERAEVDEEEVKEEERAEIDEEERAEVDEEEVKEEEDFKQKQASAIPAEIIKKRKNRKANNKRGREAMQYPKPRPNFFIGFQIYEAGIHQKVKKVQEEIIAKNPKLHPALINISTLHLTLAVTHLANEKEIKYLKEKLDKWAANTVTSFFQEPLTLSFTGIKTFRNSVAYLDIEPCADKERLLVLSENVNNVLSDAGFFTDKKHFTPHVTILKLSQNRRLFGAKKSFHDDFESLKNCQEHFGKQEISSLQLLSMDKPKDEKGYYKCFHQIFVRDPKIETGSSDCCSPVAKHKRVTGGNSLGISTEFDKKS